MIFLMMAAHDTSTITATAMVYYLAKHPEWQDKCRAESLVLGDRGHIGIEELETLEALELVFKESMRLVEPVPAMVRKTTADIDLAGYHVLAGTMISVAPGATHELGDIWTNSREFDPLRFVEPRSEHKQHRFGYVPFGGGAHKCIGMAFGSAEVKALLHKTLFRYRFEVPADYELEWDHTSLVVPTDATSRSPAAARTLTAAGSDALAARSWTGFTPEWSGPRAAGTEVVICLGRHPAAETACSMPTTSRAMRPTSSRPRQRVLRLPK